MCTEQLVLWDKSLSPERLCFLERREYVPTMALIMMRHASVDAWAQENSTLPALPVGNQAIFAGFRENA